MILVLALLLGATISENKLAVGGVQRSYRLCAPAPVAAGRPLILCFHALGQTSDGVARTTGLDSLVDRQGVLVAYPQGVGNSWNAGTCCDGNRQDDVGFALAVVAAVSAKVPVDRRRVYLVGYSNGAMLCHRLLVERSDVFAASATVAGALRVSGSPAVRRGCLMFHGSRDVVVPLADARKTASVLSAELRVHSGGHLWPAAASPATLWSFLAARSL